MKSDIDNKVDEEVEYKNQITEKLNTQSNILYTNISYNIVKDKCLIRISPAFNNIDCIIKKQFYNKTDEMKSNI